VASGLDAWGQGWVLPHTQNSEFLRARARAHTQACIDLFIEACLKQRKATLTKIDHIFI
jgi:hypothetical protein